MPERLIARLEEVDDLIKQFKREVDGDQRRRIDEAVREESRRAQRRLFLWLAPLLTVVSIIAGTAFAIGTSDHTSQVDSTIAACQARDHGRYEQRLVFDHFFSELGTIVSQQSTDKARATADLTFLRNNLDAYAKAHLPHLPCRG